MVVVEVVANSQAAMAASLSVADSHGRREANTSGGRDQQGNGSECGVVGRSTRKRKEATRMVRGKMKNMEKIFEKCQNKLFWG